MSLQKELMAVYAFNNKHEILFKKNPTVEGGTIFLCDSSHSMQDHQSLMKNIASAIKCITNTQGKWNLPQPRGGTAIIDVVNELMQKKNDGHLPVGQIIIATDGEDTSKTKRYIKAIAENDTVVWADMPEFPNFSDWQSNDRGEQWKAYYDTQMAKRREAVATHLKAIGVDTCIIGVGTEVKEFISVCSKDGIGLNTAYIEPNATVQHVGAIVQTIMRRPRGQTNRTVTASNANAITNSEVEAINTEADCTTSHLQRRDDVRLVKDGAPFNEEGQMRYIRFIVMEVARTIATDAIEPETLCEYMIGVIKWFHDLVKQLKTPVAGYLISGRIFTNKERTVFKGAVFKSPYASITESKWAGALGRCLTCLSRDVERIANNEIKQGLNVTFCHEIAANTVGPIFVETGTPHTYLALTHKELPQIAGRALYYKFKEATYKHLACAHRGANLEWNTEYVAAQDLAVVWSGNSGKNAYGGESIKDADLIPAPDPEPDELPTVIELSEDEEQREEEDEESDEEEDEESDEEEDDEDDKDFIVDEEESDDEDDEEEEDEEEEDEEEEDEEEEDEEKEDEEEFDEGEEEEGASDKDNATEASTLKRKNDALELEVSTLKRKNDALELEVSTLKRKIAKVAEIIA